ncbi:MAG TPA: cation transporter, partial [Thermomicrobiales bacterium]|nr:cation transporter [Thermomicrobiales bacterium]
MTAVPQTVELPIGGMDCAECARTVRDAIAGTPGVRAVEVLLASEKAVVRFDPVVGSLPALRAAVEGAGYRIAAAPAAAAESCSTAARLAERGFARSLLALFGVGFGFVLLAVVAGEWLGLFDVLTERVPWPVGAGIVIAIGWPVFRNVALTARRGKIIAHTLMTLGVVAALAVGQWPTAALVAIFMRAGDFAERFTTERSRQALRRVTALAPATARVERDGREIEIPAVGVRIGETVIVRPGERIPVDGVVIAGQATIDQAAITGESMPVAAEPGSTVYAATIATLGSLRVRAVKIGTDTTF